MCTRFALRANSGNLAELFWLHTWPDMGIQYNIAPTDAVAVVINLGVAWEAHPMRWGLVPGWAKAIDQYGVLPNARAETLREKPMYKNLVRYHRRALIPADGYFEWAGEKGAKQPYLFEVDQGAVFALAGLFDWWESPDGSTLESCTVITIDANETAGQIHDRMPAIVPREEWRNYLDPNQPIEAFLDPLEESRLSFKRVHPRMGNPRLKGPEAIEVIQA